MAEHVAVCCEGSVAGDRQDRVCGLLHYVKTNTARRCVGMKFLSLLFTALNLLPSRPIRLRSWEALLIGVPSTAFTMSPFCSPALSRGRSRPSRQFRSAGDQPEMAFT
jgi:hypothetical protein